MVYCCDWFTFPEHLQGCPEDVVFTPWFYPQFQDDKDLTDDFFLNVVLQTCESLLRSCARTLIPGSRVKILLTVILWAVCSSLFCHWQNVQYCRRWKHLRCQHARGEWLSEVIKDEMEWLGKCQRTAARQAGSLLLSNASQGYMWQSTCITCSTSTMSR